MTREADALDRKCAALRTIRWIEANVLDHLGGAYLGHLREIKDVKMEPAIGNELLHRIAVIVDMYLNLLRARGGLHFNKQHVGRLQRQRFLEGVCRKIGRMLQRRAMQGTVHYFSVPDLAGPSLNEMAVLWQVLAEIPEDLRGNRSDFRDIFAMFK